MCMSMGWLAFMGWSSHGPSKSSHGIGWWHGMNKQNKNGRWGLPSGQKIIIPWSSTSWGPEGFVVLSSRLVCQVRVEWFWVAVILSSSYGGADQKVKIATIPVSSHHKPLPSKTNKTKLASDMYHWKSIGWLAGYLKSSYGFRMIKVHHPMP